MLKKLLLPANKIVTRGVEFYIPEICFYKEGEAYCLFFTRDIDDSALREVGKDRLNNMFIRKTFNDRRRKYRERLAALTKIFQEVPKKKAIGVNNAFI